MCYRTGYDLFFPEGKQDARVKTPLAKAICSSPCPVRDYCLQYALETMSDYGVWGGTTRSERKRILNEIRERDITPAQWVKEQREGAHEPGA